MAPKTGPAILTLKIGGEVGASFKKSISKAPKQLSTFNQNVKRSINDAASGGARFQERHKKRCLSSAAVGCCRFRRASRAQSEQLQIFSRRC